VQSERRGRERPENMEEGEKKRVTDYKGRRGTESGSISNTNSRGTETIQRNLR